MVVGPGPGVPVRAVFRNGLLYHGSCSGARGWSAARHDGDGDGDHDFIRHDIPLSKRRAQSTGGEKGTAEDGGTHIGDVLAGIAGASGFRVGCRGLDKVSRPQDCFCMK